MRALICLVALSMAGAARGEMLLTSISTSGEDIFAGDIFSAPLPTTLQVSTDNMDGPGMRFTLGEDQVGVPQRITTPEDPNPWPHTNEYGFNWVKGMLHPNFGPSNDEFRLYFLGQSQTYTIWSIKPEDIWTDGPHTSFHGDEFIIDSNFTPPNGINLSGTDHQLSVVEFVLNDFESHAWSINPTYVAYDLNYTVSFYSSVPEPSSLLLTCWLLAAVVYKRFL